MLLGEMVGISRGECESATHTCVKLELIVAIKWFVSNFKTLCQRHIFLWSCEHFCHLVCICTFPGSSACASLGQTQPVTPSSSILTAQATGKQPLA